MSGFVFSRQALADLDRIIDYILEDAGPGSAQNVYDDLLKAVRQLAKMPHAGHRREDLRDETLRVWVVHSYLIIYWPHTDPLSISRIIHGSRDLARHRFPRPH